MNIYRQRFFAITLFDGAAMLLLATNAVSAHTFPSPEANLHVTSGDSFSKQEKHEKDTIGGFGEQTQQRRPAHIIDLRGQNKSGAGLATHLQLHKKHQAG